MPSLPGISADQSASAANWILRRSLITSCTFASNPERDVLAGVYDHPLGFGATRDGVHRAGRGTSLSYHQRGNLILVVQSRRRRW